MATLDDLLNLPGVVAAGEVRADGTPVDFKAKMDMSRDLSEIIDEYCRYVPPFLKLRVDGMSSTSPYVPGTLR